MCPPPVCLSFSSVSCRERSLVCRKRKRVVDRDSRATNSLHLGGGAELGHCTQIAHREKRTSQHRLYTNGSLKVALSQTVNFQ